MKALVFDAPHASRIAEVAEPATTSGFALVAPKYVGLCGTDLELYAGTMPYFAQGHATYPIQPGHEVSGIVLQCPDGSLDPGTRVVVDPVVGCGQCSACRVGIQTRCQDRAELGIRRGMPGAACDAFSVPARNLHVIPTGVSLREAVLVEPGVTVLNALERLGAATGKRVLVIGAGTLGLIATQLLLSADALVEVLVYPSRRSLVEAMGATPVFTIADSTYDLVLETAGAGNSVQDALRAVAPGGRIALAGLHASTISDFDINLLVLKDATVHGVLNGPGLYDRLLEHIASKRIEPSVLIDSEFSLEEASTALARLADPDRPRPKVLFRFDSPAD